MGVVCLLVVLALLGSRVLSRDAALAASVGVWGGSGEVNVLLGVHAHEERRHVHHLLAHSDVALLDEHARVVDGLGQAELEDLCL